MTSPRDYIALGEGSVVSRLVSMPTMTRCGSCSLCTLLVDLDLDRMTPRVKDAGGQHGDWPGCTCQRFEDHMRLFRYKSSDRHRLLRSVRVRPWSLVLVSLAGTAGRRNYLPTPSFHPLLGIQNSLLFFLFFYFRLIFLFLFLN